MEYNVTQDDLKTILLKCVGSKYPVRLMLRNSLSRTAFIQGFADADCSTILVSEDHCSHGSNLQIAEVIGIETLNVITLARCRGRKFSVN